MSRWPYIAAAGAGAFAVAWWARVPGVREAARVVLPGEILNMVEGVDARVPAGVPAPVAACLTGALSALGDRESGPANRGPAVDRYQPSNVTKGAGEGLPWCALFVSFWWRHGFGLYPYGQRIAGADTIKEAARRRGLWNITPKPGDAFVLLHATDTPAFERGHTGLVLRVSSDGGRVQCVEGNARNAVRLIEREVPSVPRVGAIMGFASPSQWSGTFERGLIAGAESPGGSTR